MDIQKLFEQAVTIYQIKNKVNQYQLYLTDKDLIVRDGKECLELRLMDYEQGRGAGFFLPVYLLTDNKYDEIEELYNKVLWEIMNT